MERTPELFEKIEDYLQGSLPQEELVTFEQEMEKNDALKEEVAMHRALHTTLQDADTIAFKNKLKNISAHIRLDEAPDVVSIRPNRDGLYYKMAAVIVVLFGIGTLLYTSNSAQHALDLYGAYYAPFPVEDMTRGETSIEVQDIIKQYGKGIYDSVVVALEKYPNIREQQPLSLYLGNSYLNIDQEEKAIQQFENVEDTKYLEVAQWYLSLTYLKLNKTAKVEELLLEIIGYDGTYKSRATELLELLEKK
ncbi:hypothetical protein ABW636_04025 [Aquimarina sp. 2201CG1-2-11]|uniref:tetratricopeptide repeat protein n=1 Tax=Aquimarina discodermiae TaxID=3231043 RepID=UPI003462F3A3